MKARAGGLDFLDLLISVRDLLKNDKSVRNELQEKYTHLFVDEFQDTDPLQAEIVLLLAAASKDADDYASVVPTPGKLFIVGDPKQAIYRFRRADVRLYLAIKERLRGCGAEVLALTTSFRSLPAIQGAINGAFCDHMPGPFSPQAQCDYVRLDEFRPSRADQPAVVVLPVPRPYARTQLGASAIRTSEPGAVAAYVDWLVRESGWTVAEKTDDGEKLVPIEARHICLLFRNMVRGGDDVAEPYVRAIEERGIPHLLTGGRAFHGSEEVMAVQTALTAIEWPADELYVYATLKGPLFSFEDGELLVYRNAHGKLHPLEPQDEQTGNDGAAEAAAGEIAAALGLLRTLHMKRNRQPIAVTLDALLRATRARTTIGLWRTGEQALANLQHCVQEARVYEAAGATSFRDFVEAFAADEGRAAAGVSDDDVDGIRMMTVHGAKGLEFPVVILCDCALSRDVKRPSRYIDPANARWVQTLCGMMPRELQDHAAAVIEEDQAEEVRIAYVAATRARDLLVVPCVGDKRFDGWVDVLHDTLYPERHAFRDSGAAEGCPTFADDSVLERPEGCNARPDQSVKPGWHGGCAEGHGVVWWDPRALPLETLEDDPIDASQEPSAELARRYADEERAWSEARATALEQGAAPSRVVKTVTALSTEPLGDDGGGEVTVEEVAGRDATRPRGPRFGTLVHGILERIPLGADRAAIAKLANLMGRLTGSHEDDVTAAVAAVSAALGHPLVQRAAKSEARNRCRREAPMLLRLDDGTVAEGVVDLAFQESDDGGWTVVDFKTDLTSFDNPRYKTQVALYAKAVAQATGATAKGVLLAV